MVRVCFRMITSPYMWSLVDHNKISFRIKISMGVPLIFPNGSNLRGLCCGHNTVNQEETAKYEWTSRRVLVFKGGGLNTPKHYLISRFSNNCDVKCMMRWYDFENLLLFNIKNPNELNGNIGIDKPWHSERPDNCHQGQDRWRVKELNEHSLADQEGDKNLYLYYGKVTAW